jgi:hypothetical protein
MVRWYSIRDMARLKAIVVVLLFACVSIVRAEERTLSVFVFTATPAFMDKDAQQRTDSVVDLRKALKGTKAFALAASPGSADLVVEITGAGMAEADRGIAMKYNGPLLSAGRSNSGDWRCVVDLAVSVGDYTQHFTNTDAPLSRSLCLGAAYNLAGQLTTWTKDNRAQIVK